MSEIKRILYKNMSADHVAFIGMTAKADTVARFSKPNRKELAFLRDYEKNLAKYASRVKGNPDQQFEAKQKTKEQLREFFRNNPDEDYLRGLTEIEVYAVHALA